MSRSLKQICYIGTNTYYSNPSGLTIAQLTQPLTFLNGSSERAIQIGVQAPEGTAFRINGGSKIVIGRTNLFEWSVENTGDYINSFCFLNGEDGCRDLSASDNYIVDFYLESGSNDGTGE